MGIGNCEYTPDETGGVAAVGERPPMFESDVVVRRLLSASSADVPAGGGWPPWKAKPVGAAVVVGCDGTVEAGWVYMYVICCW